MNSKSWLNTIGDYLMDPYQFEREFKFMLNEKDEATLDLAKAHHHKVTALVFYSPIGPVLRSLKEDTFK